MSIAPELRDALESGTLVLCVGSGPSLAAGLPSREQLARALLGRAGELQAGANLDGLARWIDQGRIAEVLEQLERMLGTDFQREVEGLLSDQGKPLPPIAGSIARLRTKLRAIYTLRLDRVLERALEGRWPSFSSPRPDLSQRRSLVFKLRGTLEFPHTWVLTHEQEQREFGPQGARREIVETCYLAHRLLLIGFEIGSTDLAAFLDMLPTHVDGHVPLHHIVLPACDPLERTQLESRGLQVIVGDAEALVGELAGSKPESSSETPSAARSPYPGLEAFGEAQASMFFGRHGEISQAAAQLGGVGGVDHHWLSIEGPSGIGKSSFARAGVLPALRRGFAEGMPSRFRVAAFRPGSAPLTQLARAVADALELPAPSDPEQLRSNPRWLSEQARRVGAGEGLLLLIDQFEEVSTLASSKDRAPFGELLVRALEAEAIYLITTTRSDLIPALQREMPRLASLLNGDAQRYALPPISRVGLREAICEPAARHGVSIEPALVEQILLDAEQGQHRASMDATRTADATLPLVAHILRGLWTEQNIADRSIGLAEYVAIGGITGALSRSADELVDALGDRPHIRELFLRLVRLQPDGSATRGVLSLEEARQLGDEHTLAVLSGARAPREGAKLARLLLVREDGGVQELELVHEALIRDWSRLRTWIEQGKEQLQLDDELARRAARWTAQGKLQADLPRGADMAALLRGRVHGSAQQRAMQTEFQAAMQRSSKRRRMLVGGGLATLLALVVGLYVAVDIDTDTCSINLARGPKIRRAAIVSAGDVALATVVPQTTILYPCEQNTRAEQAGLDRPRAVRPPGMAMIELPGRPMLALLVPASDEALTVIVETETGEIFHFIDVRADATIEFETQKIVGFPPLDADQLGQLGQLDGFEAVQAMQALAPSPVELEQAATPEEPSAFADVSSTTGQHEDVPAATPDSVCAHVWSVIKKETPGAKIEKPVCLQWFESAEKERGAAAFEQLSACMMTAASLAGFEACDPEADGKVWPSHVEAPADQTGG